MTFQEWRTRHSGVVITAMAETDVFMVSDRLLPGGPLAELRTLEDYWVTSEMLQAHYGPTVWIAPRLEDKRDWTRKDYMDRRVDHQRYYVCLAEIIGKEMIEKLILRSLFKHKSELIDHYRRGKDLNSLSSHYWDSLHYLIRPMVARNGAAVMARSWSGTVLQKGTICWSLSESVCVAKAVARAMVEELIAAEATGNGKVQ